MIRHLEVRPRGQSTDTEAWNFFCDGDGGGGGDGDDNAIAVVDGDGSGMTWKRTAQTSQ